MVCAGASVVATGLRAESPCATVLHAASAEGGRARNWLGLG